MKITNITKNSVIAERADMADSFFSRMIGLLNRNKLLEGEGLVITKCQSIHMFFMRFAIDCIFTDKTNTVIGLVKGIKPNRLSRIYPKASYVVELPTGVIDQSSTALGDRIEITGR